MKTITIRLPDVEAAMLQYLKARRKDFRDLDAWFALQIRDTYGETLRK
jgi:hypothetical protein